jgi:ribonuclease HI
MKKTPRDFPITVWTDGSCWNANAGGDGKGGWAFVATWRGRVLRRFGHLPRTTNNEAELTAIYRALCFVQRTEHPLEIITDSQYCYRALCVWRFGWADGGWVNSVGNPVANLQLLQRIIRLIEWHRETRALEFNWTRGHAGTALNEEADVLAGNARRDGDTDDRGCEFPLPHNLAADTNNTTKGKTTP